MREPLGRQRQHDLIQPAQATLAPGQHDRSEAAVAVPGHIELDRADLGQDRRGLLPLREFTELCPAGS
jgi:hypothetical protein